MAKISNRYADEITYDRVVDKQGNTKRAQTIKFLDRTYNKDEIILHIVTDGQTLFSIADTYYGDFRKWYLIAEKNPNITNPFVLQNGMELVIPEVE